MLNYSTGHGSTGNYSTGKWSTGFWSTGDHSTGNGSTGKYSTGNRSTGNYSTGNRSTGNRSTGDWSTSDWSTGHFCTIDGMGFGAFNKIIHEDFSTAIEIWSNAEKPHCLFFNLTEWVKSEEMTELEKKKNPTHKKNGGYLRVLDYKESFTKSVVSATKEERDMIRALPNFDDDIFFEISGCDLRKLDGCNIIEVNGKKYKLIEEE